MKLLGPYSIITPNQPGDLVEDLKVSDFNQDTLYNWDKRFPFVLMKESPVKT